jgi:hypothetical protein
MAQAETRRLAAIMFTDMVGFSRQMGATVENVDMRVFHESSYAALRSSARY